VSVYPPMVARQRLSKHVLMATNTHATIERNVGRGDFYAVRVA
jgi:hypothetical protein